MKREELGCAGHLIVSARCRWRRHTQVGDYRVSSVGDYFPADDMPREQIGAGSPEQPAYFETMVFELSDELMIGSEGCGCREPKGWSEVDCRRYSTAGAAQRGHEQIVEQIMAGTFRPYGEEE